MTRLVLQTDTPRQRFQLRSPRALTSTPVGRVRLAWYIKLLLTYLAAITIVGKGPTYIGVPPVYWGEVTMVVALLFIAPQIRGTKLLDNTRYLTIAIVAFMAVGAALTITSFPKWHINALRDAAIWYYALFYFVGLGLASQKAIGDRVWGVLRVCWIISLIWHTTDILSGGAISRSGPIVPGRGNPLFGNSVHEAGQNMALGALVVLCTSTLRKKPILIRAGLTCVAMGGLALFAAQGGRGMRVGIASGALLVMLLSLAPNSMPHFDTRLLKLAAVAIPLLAVVALAMPDRFLKVANLDRFAEADPAKAEGTAEWRLIWWSRIYEQVMKRNPAFGLGFGESLHVYHPLLESSEDEFVIRSPHNFNVTIFARMGIVGVLLWATILFLGIGSLFARVWKGSINGTSYTAARRDELTFWILMLVCTVVNSSFGVLMEGPVLGIWFWFALGFALARSFSPEIEFRPRMVLSLPSRRVSGLSVSRAEGL